MNGRFAGIATWFRREVERRVSILTYNLITG
jgi:hypothetical protein